MAIDDNTTYGLTGAQVKDLASRIQNAGGGVKVINDGEMHRLEDLEFETFYRFEYPSKLGWKSATGGQVIADMRSGDNRLYVIKLYQWDHRVSVGDGGAALVWGYNNPTTFNHVYYVGYTASSVISEFPLRLIGNLTTSGSSAAAGALSAFMGYELNRKILGISTNTEGTAASWTSIGTGSAYTKRALQVTLNISETSLTIPADTWTSLGITLPTSYRPTIIMNGGITANNGTSFETGLVRVNIDGTVEVHTSNAVTEVYGAITFPVAS